jgi:ABC-type polysaccharide/polyol phosphate export permease
MLRTGYRGAVEYLTTIWGYRYFWMSLVKAELQRRYRRSVLGLGWSLLQPISMTVVLAVVYARLFHMNMLEFAPLVFTGLAVWNYLSGNVLQGCTSLLSAEPYIRQQYIPMAIFPLRTVLTVGFHGLISLGVSVAFVFVARVLNGQSMGPLTPLLSLPATLVLLFLLGWSLAVLASFAHVYFPDTQHLMEVALQVLLYLHPILYPPSLLANTHLGVIMNFSPLTILVQLIRDPIVSGVVPPLHLYVLAVSFVALFLACASWVLARLEHRLIFAM